MIIGKVHPFPTDPQVSSIALDSPTLLEVFTLCASMIAAVGTAARPLLSRTCSRTPSDASGVAVQLEQGVPTGG